MNHYHDSFESLKKLSRDMVFIFKLGNLELNKPVNKVSELAETLKPAIKRTLENWSGTTRKTHRKMRCRSWAQMKRHASFRSKLSIVRVQHDRTNWIVDRDIALISKDTTWEPQSRDILLRWQSGLPTLKHIAVSWNYFNLRVKIMSYICLVTPPKSYCGFFKLAL